jgi:endonuclease G
MKKILILIIIFFITATSCPQAVPEQDVKSVYEDYLPNENYISYSQFDVRYDHTFQIPIWTAYELKPTELYKKFDRHNNFKEDPNLDIEQGENSDYYKSGYDRGHMVPNRDILFDELGKDEVNYYTNIIPQNSQLNRGKWSRLETATRNWAYRKGRLIVFTGIIPIPIDTIGDGVIVPESIYKIIIDPEPNPEAISFLIPNKDINLDIENYIVTIDRIEEKTNIDFLYEIEDILEEKIESTTNKQNWEFDYNNYNYKIVTATGLNLRESPTENSKSILIIEKGTVIRVSSHFELEDWIEIEYKNHIGYIDSKYTK